MVKRYTLKEIDRELIKEAPRTGERSRLRYERLSRIRASLPAAKREQARINKEIRAGVKALKIRRKNGLLVFE